MTGLNPERVPDTRAWNEPGPAKCLALLYRGKAVIIKRNFRAEE